MVTGVKAVIAASNNIVAVFGLAVLALRALWIGYFYHGEFTPVFFSVLLLTTAYGLIRLSRWARYGVIVILWLLIIVVPIGVINPFFASDLAASGTEAPPVEILLAIIAPFVIWGVFCLHILGKYKTKFV